MIIKILISDVVNYIDLLITIHSNIINKSICEIYHYLLEQEEEFIQWLNDRNSYSAINIQTNFIHHIYLLNNTDKTKINYNLVSTKDLLSCIYCNSNFDTETTYNLHILMNDVFCESCGNVVCYKNFVMNNLAKKIPIQKKQTGCIFTYTKFEKFIMSMYNNRFMLDKRYNPLQYNINISKLEEYLKIQSNNITYFNCDLIKEAINQLSFINQIIKNIPRYITIDKISNCIQDYKDYIDLVKKSKRQLVPTIDIELIHQSHIKSTKYAELKSIAKYLPKYNNYYNNKLNYNHAITCILWTAQYKKQYANINLDKHFVLTYYLGQGCCIHLGKLYNKVNKIMSYYTKNHETDVNHEN